MCLLHLPSRRAHTFRTCTCLSHHHNLQQTLLLALRAWLARLGVTSGACYAGPTCASNPLAHLPGGHT